MRAVRLQDALERLTAAIRDVESELAAMKAEHDPLASHIFVSRRHYRNVHDTKSGKRRERIARLCSNFACDLGFRGASTNGNASLQTRFLARRIVAQKQHVASAPSDRALR